MDNTQLILEEDSNAVVTRGALKVAFTASGLAVTVNGKNIVVDPDGKVSFEPGPSNDSQGNDSKKELQPGDTMPDGTIFAGVSPDTGRNMFVTPKDAPHTLRWYGWNAAMKYAADLDAGGHKDWRLPSKAELDVLYQNRQKGALKGTFDESGSHFAGWYWSSGELPDCAVNAWEWVERFSDGHRYRGWKGNDASVRPVRSEPRP